MLLQEFDPAKRAVVNPDQMFHPIPNFPETMVSIFSHQLFYEILEFLDGEEIACTNDVDGIWPVYEVKYKGKRFAFFKAAPTGCACWLHYISLWGFKPAFFSFHVLSWVQQTRLQFFSLLLVHFPLIFTFQQARCFYFRIPAGPTLLYTYVSTSMPHISGISAGQVPSTAIL